MLAASPYLAAAYLAQGAFKEPLLALALLGFTLGLPALRGDLVRARADRRGPPSRSGVIAAGTIYNYSFPGLAWLLGAAIVWMLVIALREHDLRLGERLRGARSAIALGIAIPVVAALPEIFRLASFSNFKAFSPSGTGPTVGFGNLRQPLNPLEALGVWPSGEFRITPANSTTPEIAFYLGALLALVGVRVGPGSGTVEAGVRAALGAARVDAALPGVARGRHPVHAGEGAGDRRSAGHGDRAARAALGGLAAGRGGRTCRRGEGRLGGRRDRCAR